MNELTTTDTPGALIARETDAAGACKAIVTATAQNIQGRRYVKVEGWQAIAVAHGCVASARDVERVEGGIRAVGEIRRREDGLVICTAEGFVGDDEQMWAKRPEFARRAMAQTRAISRACRSAFAHVVVMMNAGLETTPAEEMDGVQVEQRKATAPTPPPPAESKEKPTLYTEQTLLDNVHVLKVQSKQGQTGDKKWTLYGVQCDGPDGTFWANTFDSKFAEYATEAAKADAPVTVQVAPGKKGGLDLITIGVTQNGEAE